MLSKKVKEYFKLKKKLIEDKNPLWEEIQSRIDDSPKTMKEVEESIEKLIKNW